MGVGTVTLEGTSESENTDWLRRGISVGIDGGHVFQNMHTVIVHARVPKKGCRNVGAVVDTTE